jgi:predicted dehydrogenase
MTHRLRVAVIGTGFVGPHHVDAARRTGLADVVAVAGSSVERARPVADRLGIEDVRTADEVLADPAIDVVHVCTPNASHADLGRRALEAGKHVMMEKPLALDTTEADDLVRRAAEARRHAAVAFTYRGYPMVRRARADAQDGRLGEIRLAFGAYLQDWLLEESDYNWRVDPVAGGRSRAVADIGSHWFDTLEYVSSLRVAEVMADLRTFITSRTRPSGATTTFARGGDGESVPIRSEDAATILLRFEGGAMGTFLISQISAGHANDFSWELMGSRASVEWRQEDPELLRYSERDLGSVTVRRAPSADPESGVPSLPAGHPEGWSDALRDLFRDLYASILRGQPPAIDEPYPTFADGQRAVRFVDAVLRSAERGSWERP